MKKIALFVVVLAAVAMVSCGGNANKSKECADHACTECCGEGQCTKPIEEQCDACKAKTAAAACEQACAECEQAADACCEKKAECEKACCEKKAECEKAGEACKQACEKACEKAGACKQACEKK